MFFAAIALATLALSAATTTERLLTSKIYDNYDVHKLCRSARREKYLGLEVGTPFEYELSPFGRAETHKIRSRIHDCCTRPSIFEKKQCLKNVREYYLDTKCDRGITHTCCKTSGPQRYFCFSKNPFTTLPYNVDKISRLENERQFSYLENVEDILSENVYGMNPLRNIEEAEYIRREVMPELEIREEIDNMRLSSNRPWASPERRLETAAELLLLDNAERRESERELLDNEMLVNTDYLVDDDEEIEIIEKEGEINELENELLMGGGRIGRKCVNSNSCRRKLEKATRLAAKETCTKNMLKGGRRTSETCCEAGTIVGATVGKTHSKVCVPALYKFQTKVQGCGVNHKPQCKNAFVQCCKEAKMNRRTLGLNYEIPSELMTETYEEIMEEVVPYPFKNYF